MTELLYRKKGTKKFAGIHVYCFWSARDHPREKDEEQLKKTIDAFMEEKGWEKA